MNKEIDVFIPINDNNSYFNNLKNDEIIINKDIKIIPYFMINEDNIAGYDKFEYNLGIFSLYDFKNQDIYLSLLDDNIDIQLYEEYKEFKLIKKNKIYLLQIEIPEKKREEIEIFNKKVLFKLSYKEKIKQISFNIKFKTEVITVYIQCDEYKMIYLGNNKFSLCTKYLLKDETINIQILNDSYNSKIKNKISLQTLRNNTCKKPTKIEKEKGFSLTINSDQNDSNNVQETLSFYINVYIGERFKFIIKIESLIKIFDYEFKIKYPDLDGFVSQQLSCPLNTKEFEIL